MQKNWEQYLQNDDEYKQKTDSDYKDYCSFCGVNVAAQELRIKTRQGWRNNVFETLYIKYCEECWKWSYPIENEPWNEVNKMEVMYDNKGKKLSENDVFGNVWKSR